MAEDEIRDEEIEEVTEGLPVIEGAEFGAQASVGEGNLIELMKVSMNGEEFLIPVNEVSEILRPVSVTPVLMAPDHVLGLANIHGQVVCVVDAGKVLHLKGERGAQGEETRYLILRHPRMHLAIWVDSATELFRVSNELLPEADSEAPGHLRGVMEIEGRFFNLLNTSILFE